MNKTLKLLTPTLLLLSACSQFNVKSTPSMSADRTPILNESSEFNGEALAKHVEKNTCDGCLIGSSSHQTVGDADKKVYFLYGAEHLNLNN